MKTESHDSIAKIARFDIRVDELHLDEKEESYEAAVMIEIAVRIEIDCIITRNLKDYAGVPLLVYFSRTARQAPVCWRID